MLKQIVRISVHQTSRIIALIHFILSVIVIIPVALWIYFVSGDPVFFGFLIFPFFNLLVSYIITAFFCWVYNIVAKSFGGIEFELLGPEE